MERQGDEIHIETDEARGGSSSHVVRYVLIISVVLAIAALSLIWITGALSQGDIEEEATVSGAMQDENAGRDTDSILLDSSEEGDALQSDAATVDGATVIEN